MVVVLRRPLEGREERGFLWAAVLAALSFGPAYRLAAAIPFDAFELIAVRRQILWLMLTYVVLSIPFLLGGAAVALAFTIGKDRISRLYAANLVGSGAGAALGLALLAWLPAERLPAVAGVVASLAALALARWGPAVCAAAIAFALLPPPAIPVSTYKEESMALRLPESRILAQDDGPLGRLRLVAAPSLRYLPGTSLALEEPVPPRPVLYLDGQPLGPRATASDTSLLAMTTSAAAFVVRREPRPSVLLLGLGGGGSIWLARSAGAGSITVVDPDPRIDPLLSPGTLGTDVRRLAAAPRGFLAASDQLYDVVLVTELGSLHGGAAGMAAAGASYLFTEEGVRAMWAALDDRGILAITRWALDPPRDGLRLLATMRAVLDREGLPASHHVALVRGWGTATLILSRPPFTEEEGRALGAWASERWFDVVWAPGVPAALANRFNVLEPDLYRAGAEALLGPRPEEFIARYPFEIAPASDDAPFFFHFLGIAPLIRLWRAGGRLALPYFEWGIVAQFLVLIQAVPIAAAFILLPLLFLRFGRRNEDEDHHSNSAGRSAGRLPLFLYFALLGLAFMVVEVTAIQRLVLLLPQPIYATTIVIAVFLAFAGLGSAAAPRIAAHRPTWLPFAAIALLAPLSYGAEIALWSSAAGAPLAVRIALAAMFLAPLAFCMGLPFPVGLQRVADRRPRWIPWCWGVNGFLSVIGAAAAPIVALGIGFRGALLLAAGLYLVAGWTLRHL